MRARLDGAERASSCKWHISPISRLKGVYMGIDVHALNFIRYAEKQQPLGSVATIGRQGLHISKAKLRSIFPSARNYGPYCEELLIDLLGATKVESFDNSDYEQATHIADMNLPIECASDLSTFSVGRGGGAASRMIAYSSRIMFTLGTARTLSSQLTYTSSKMTLTSSKNWLQTI
jgi:hypothetical protein